jgi:4-amino-4-deoxy-L-arabinose transferase-like glycosyltransferase
LFEPAARGLDWPDRISAALLLLALVLRVSLSSPDIFQDYRAGEATRAAIAYARDGVLADAYFDGQGPTAHLMPIMPAIAGMVYRVFGVATPAANFTLLLWAVLQVAVAYGLTYALCRRLGFSRAALVLAAVILTIPVYSNTEVLSYRFWEGALCVSLVSLTLLLMTSWSDALSTRRIAVLAGIGAFTFFANPIVGLALFAAIGAYCWSVRPKAFLRAALLGAAFSAMLVAPWTARNYVQLGHPVALRSNFGLELRMSNHPGAVAERPSEQAYLARMAEMHPYKSPYAQQQVRQFGEVAYSSRLLTEAVDWIRGNPSDFGLLSLKRLRDFYLPPAWAYDFWERESIRRTAAVLVPLIVLIGLAWLAAGAWTNRPMFRKMLAYAVVVGLPYALVQPLPRYTYVLYILLAFLAAEALVSTIAGKWLKLGERQAPRSLLEPSRPT